MDCCTTTGATARAPRRACPRCGSRGRAIQDTTLDSLLVSPAVRPPGTWRSCREPSCPVVYFNVDEGTELGTDALRVRVGYKEIAPDRPICYCFGYSAEDLQREVRDRGVSTLPDAIAAACKRGDARCAQTNPQGSCCLGNVRAVVQAAIKEMPT